MTNNRVIAKCISKKVQNTGAFEAKDRVFVELRAEITQETQFPFSINGGESFMIEVFSKGMAEMFEVRKEYFISISPIVSEEGRQQDIADKLEKIKNSVKFPTICE